jgi:hypothetical protein
LPADPDGAGEDLSPPADVPASFDAPDPAEEDADADDPESDDALEGVVDDVEPAPLRLSVR